MRRLKQTIALIHSFREQQSDEHQVSFQAYPEIPEGTRYQHTFPLSNKTSFTTLKNKQESFFFSLDFPHVPFQVPCREEHIPRTILKIKSWEQALKAEL